MVFLNQRTGRPVMTENILVVVAHGDDEVLGAGGFIAKRTAFGDRVRVVILADGVGARSEKDIEESRQRRQAASCKSCQILGAEAPIFHDYLDNRMDLISVLDVAKCVESHIHEFNPSWVLTHHDSDVNVDHKKTHLACQAACRPQLQSPVKRLLFMEVASSTEWRTQGAEAPFFPNWFEDISSHNEQKQQALAAYAEEMREWPHPRSYKGVDALNAWRGATIGVDRAEAFQLGRAIS